MRASDDKSRGGQVSWEFLHTPEKKRAGILRYVSKWLSERKGNLKGKEFPLDYLVFIYAGGSRASRLYRVGAILRWPWVHGGTEVNERRW